MRDTTAKRAAESALRYQSALIAHVSDAITATGADSKVTSWNPAAEAIYGRSATEAVGRPGRRLGRRASRYQRDTAVGRGGPCDASAIPPGIAACPVFSCPDGRAGMSSSSRTRPRRRRAERHFATVVASLEEGVLVVAPNGVIESANSAALRILGMRADGCQLRGESG
jgi:PAS domain-containing protein